MPRKKAEETVPKKETKTAAKTASAKTTKTKATSEKEVSKKPATKANAKPVVVEEKKLNDISSFEIGKAYKIVADTAVRKGPGFNQGVKLNATLMPDGKKCKLNANGELNAGTTIVCKEITKGAGDQIWVRCPSGWIIAYCDGKEYLSMN